METAQVKQRGNPNFGKRTEPAQPGQTIPSLKRKPEVIEDFKMYEFELIHSYPNYKPKDRDTDKSITSPYPKLYGRPNNGIAYDENFVNPDGSKGKARNWRLIEGQPSIWVDEQPGLENMEEQEIERMLGQPENQLEFINGKLTVRGIQKTRVMALMVQDVFEGKQVQYRVRPREYRLNNPDEIVNNNLNGIELEYSAMNKAMNATTEEMLQACFTMGINIDDQSESGLKRIRMEFLSKAKLDPKNPKGIEFFLNVMSNPATKISYIFSQGLAQGIISATQQQNKLTWAQPNTPILTINSNGNVVDQLTSMVIDKNPTAVNTMNEIEKQLYKED